MQNRLREFRARHRPERLGPWSYYLAGGGPQCILFLHGGLGTGESWFEYLTALEPSCRLLAPAIPSSATTVSEVLNGLLDIMDAESVPGAHLFGHAEGGCVAQAFARVFPERTHSLMLSNTVLPDASQASHIESRIRLAQILPGPLLGFVARSQLTRLLQTGAPELSREQAAFWREHLSAQLAGPHLREAAIASARLQLDYHSNLVFARDDLAGWPGRVLLFETERDTFAGPDEAGALRAVYRGARVRFLQDAGYLAILSRTPEYLTAIRDFLGRPQRGAQPADGGLTMR